VSVRTSTGPVVLGGSVAVYRPEPLAVTREQLRSPGELVFRHTAWWQPLWAVLRTVAAEAAADRPDWTPGDEGLGLTLTEVSAAAHRVQVGVDPLLWALQRDIEDGDAALLDRLMAAVVLPRLSLSASARAVVVDGARSQLGATDLDGPSPAIAIRKALGGDVPGDWDVDLLVGGAGGWLPVCVRTNPLHVRHVEPGDGSDLASPVVAVTTAPLVENGQHRPWATLDRNERGLPVLHLAVDRHAATHLENALGLVRRLMPLDLVPDVDMRFHTDDDRETVAFLYEHREATVAEACDDLAALLARHDVDPVHALAPAVQVGWHDVDPAVARAKPHGRVLAVGLPRDRR
jgi:hypothetical protein